MCASMNGTDDGGCHFAGFVTDDIVKRKEQKLRRALKNDIKVRVKGEAQPEVAQVIE